MFKVKTFDKVFEISIGPHGPEVSPPDASMEVRALFAYNEVVAGRGYPYVEIEEYELSRVLGGDAPPPSVKPDVRAPKGRVY